MGAAGATATGAEAALMDAEAEALRACRLEEEPLGGPAASLDKRPVHCLVLEEV